MENIAGRMRTWERILLRSANTLFVSSGNGKIASWSAIVGFIVMMTLDVTLGWISVVQLVHYGWFSPVTEGPVMRAQSFSGEALQIFIRQFLRYFRKFFIREVLRSDNFSFHIFFSHSVMFRERITKDPSSQQSMNSLVFLMNLVMYYTKIMRRVISPAVMFSI